MSDTKRDAADRDTEGQRPEALATFAEAARADGRKPVEIGLTATPDTAPIPTDSAEKDRAATKVLQRGVTGQDAGADAAVDALPDLTPVHLVSSVFAAERMEMVIEPFGDSPSPLGGEGGSAER